MVTVAAGAGFKTPSRGAFVRPRERAPSRMSSKPRARNHLRAAPATGGRDPFSLRRGGLHEKACSASGLVLAGKAPGLCCLVLAQVGEGILLRGATCGRGRCWHRPVTSSSQGGRRDFASGVLRHSPLAESFPGEDPGAEPARPVARPGSSARRRLPLPLSCRLLSWRTPFGGGRFSRRMAWL